MKNFLIKYLSIVFLTIVPALSFAQSFIDWGEMSPDSNYHYEALIPVSGFFTPQESGLIRTYSTGDEINAFEDASHNSIMQPVQSYYGPNGEKVRIYSVTLNQTIFFANDFPLSEGSFHFTSGKEEISLQSLSPNPQDGKLSLSSFYSLSLAFNIPVKCTKCKLIAGDLSTDVPFSVANSVISIDWLDAIMNWYRNGCIKSDDVISIAITGIRDEYDSSNRPDFGEGLGKLTISFILADKPAELILQSGTPPAGTTDFLTFYLPGGNDGIVSLSFDKPLDPNSSPIATIKYGDLDNQDFNLYVETIPVLIDGNTASVNLQGVPRFPDLMVPGLPAQEWINLNVSEIKSADGQYVMSGVFSNPRSFDFSYRLKSVVYSIAADWSPLPYDPIHSGDDMEIWILNGNHIIFDSLDFEYLENGMPKTSSVQYSDMTCRIDPDYDDAILLNLKAPLMNPDADTDIFVSFGNLICADGLDHSYDVSVLYRADASSVESLFDINPAHPQMFDLQGRRVNNPENIIFIRNGKKILQ